MWFFKDIILMVGSVIMVVISTIGLIGLGFDVREIDSNIGSWGITGLELGFIFLVVSFVAVVVRLIMRLNRFEKVRPYIDIYPNSIVGRDITLVVHNKSKMSADFSATMTLTFDIGERAGIRDAKIQGLMNVSMCWEASGRTRETIDGDGRKILKVCSTNERIENNITRHYVEFYKVESSQLQSVEFWPYSEDGSAIPEAKVKVTIQIDSNVLIKGRRIWDYEIRCINNGAMLTISLLKKSRHKSFARKVLSEL